MSGTPQRQVVVGVDGTDTSTAAALWAADEAQIRGARLVVLYSYELYAYGSKDAAPPGSGPYEEAEIAAAELVDAVVKKVKERHHHLHVEPDIRHESAGTALIDASGESLLTVVSSRGHSARTEELVGSFAIHTAEHGLGPVAVVRSDVSDLQPAGPVVVGADGSEVSDRAIDFAFETAAARRAPLHVVHCWDHGPVRGFRRHADTGVDADSFDQQQLADLTEALAARVAAHPDVEVIPAVVHGKPQVALRDYVAEQGGTVLVVGTRGVGGFAGLVLGSTSRTLLAHAEVPVVVVRPESATE